jgi:hypothetical protein
MMPAHDPGTPNLTLKTIEEPARQVPLYGEYEVAVLGTRLRRLFCDGCGGGIGAGRQYTRA